MCPVLENQATGKSERRGVAARRRRLGVADAWYTLRSQVMNRTEGCHPRSEYRDGQHLRHDASKSPSCVSTTTLIAQACDSGSPLHSPMLSWLRSRGCEGATRSSLPCTSD